MTETGQPVFSLQEPHLPIDSLTVLSGLPMLTGWDGVGETRPWLTPAAQRRVAAVTGVAIACTSVGSVIDLLHQTPQYEGRLTLNPTVSPAPAPADASPTPAAAPPTPTIDRQTQSQILRSPRYINPVVERLQASHPDLSYADIVDRLEIAVAPNQQVQVSYRDDQPEKVQQVLEQLAQSYVNQSPVCQDSRCRGIAFIESQLPGLQQRLHTLRQQLQTLQQTGTQTLPGQVRLLAARETEVARQKTELNSNLTQARQHYVLLQRRLAIQPGGAIADRILKQDPQYQSVLTQFQQVNTQIVQEFGRLQESPRLPSLYQQHQTLLIQLQQTAARALQQFLAAPPQAPLLQDPGYLQILQQSVGTTHTLHVLEARQQMLNQLQSQFGYLRDRLIAQVRQYERVQTELRFAHQTWQQYLSELATLQQQPAAAQAGWAIAAAPKLTTDAAGQPVSIQSSELPWEIGLGATVGIALGMGTVSLLNRNSGKRVVQQPAWVWDRVAGERSPEQQNNPTAVRGEAAPKSAGSGKAVSELPHLSHQSLEAAAEYR